MAPNDIRRPGSMNAAWPSAQFFARFGSRAPDSG
jgi:hypothetical protein